MNAPGGSAPASLSWIFSYPASDVTSFNIVAGPALAVANKALNCVPAAGSIACLAFSLDSSAIGSGVVATVTVALTASTGSTSDSIPVNNVMAAYPDGTYASISGAGGTITLLNPVPTISSLSPASTSAGSPAFTITVTGTGFLNTSVVNWNGSARATTFVSATQLTTAITAADIAVAGTAQVTVFNPPPGGGTSGSTAFTVNAPNPVPTISSLSPSSATAGSAAFTITITGTGFLNGSVVNWNGSARTATFVSATQLTAAIAATDIAAAGTGQVTVFNPAPGGGTSGSVAFSINAPNPVPTISTLSPSSTTAGTAGFTLAVNGTGFISGSVVNWNGSARTTTFVSATQLTASVTAADIAAAGAAQVTVFNPAPGGGTSGSTAFTVNAPNPVPTISSLSPSSATAGSAAFTITVTGTGFLNASVVNWNGSIRTTTFVSATQLTASVTAADIAAAGTAQVTVFDPAPGGGTSGSTAFTVNAPNPVPTISSLSPSSATAGSAAFTITITGTGFLNASVVNWNGSVRTTTFVGATQLTASVTAADIAAAGAAQVTVFNPAPGGGTSGSLAFRINAPNPVPTISSLSPAGATAGSAAFTLTVRGTGFLPSSVVNWNGSNRATTYMNGNKLTATITATDVAVAGAAQVTVATPAPGGNSGAVTFVISVGRNGPSSKSETRDFARPSESETRSDNRLVTLSCNPRILSAGHRATCELRVAPASATMEIQVTSSSDQIRVPSSIATRSNQPRLKFQVAADPTAKQQAVSITATAGAATVYDSIQVDAASGPVLIAPRTQGGTVGRALGFVVTAVDPADLPVQLDASNLPAGASFEPSAGRFEWVPSVSQVGGRKVTFRATSSTGQFASAEVALTVSSGTTAITDGEKFVCSPGALVSLNGSDLAEPGLSLSDPSGGALVLGSTRVRINGQYTPVVFASEDRVGFLCPWQAPDSQLEAVVESGAGISNPLTATMQAASPQIFSVDSSGQNQGLISFVGGTELAMPRNYLVPAHPAQPGDEILIWGTGFGLSPTDMAAATVQVRLGGVYAQVESVRAVPSHAGVYTIQARVPMGTEFGDGVPVQVQVTTPDGKRFDSNEVTLAVESASQ